MNPSATRHDAPTGRAARPGGGVFALAYGLSSYLLFLASFGVCWIAFLADRWLPITVDHRPGDPLPLWGAVAVDLTLVLLFGLQHSVMARPGFKRWWTRRVPPALERSTYVLLASLFLCLLMACWQPLPEVVWQVDAPTGQGLLWALFGLGLPFSVLASFQISHSDLFGLRQVWARFRGRPYTPPPFIEPWLYRTVRHPIQLGALLLLWPTPTMTAGHLLLATSMTVYILIGLYFEERDLIAAFGYRYRAYRARVPGLIPVPFGRIVRRLLTPNPRRRSRVPSRSNIGHLAVGSIALLGALATAAAAAPPPAPTPDPEPPVPISPGDGSRMAPVETGCPTFSWTVDLRAAGYEIAVYELAGDDPEKIGSTPALHARLPAGAGSWTPPADRCLRPGGRYAWSVRMLAPGRQAPWSEPLLVEVPDRTPAGSLGEDATRRGLRSPDAETRAPAERPALRPAPSPLLRRESPAESTARGRKTGTPPGSGQTVAPRVTPATAKLAVRGSIQTDSDFTYKSLRFLRVLVPAASFVISDANEDDSWQISSDGYGFVPSIPDTVASVKLVATVPPLPDGATITAFVCHYADLSAGSDLFLAFNLRHRASASLTAKVMASVSGSSQSNNPAVTGRFDNTIEDPIANPSVSAYVVDGRFEPGEVGTNLRFYGCSLDLETRTVRP